MLFRSIQGRLTDILEKLREMPVTTWLQEKRENAQDVAETVRLMAEVVYALSVEIDLYSHHDDEERDIRPGSGDASAPEEEELVDLESLPDDDEL